MTAKKYLLRIKRLDNQIKHRRKSLKDIEQSRLYLHGAVDGERVQTSPNGDSFTNESITFLDMYKDLIDEELRYFAERERIIAQIEGLDSAAHSQLLYMLYVDYAKYPDLLAASLELDKSYDYVRHMHGWALEAFAKKYL